MKIFFTACLLTIVFSLSAQETCTLSTSGNIENLTTGTATWSCTGASSNPIGMVSNAGNQVIIPAGLTITITGNQTWQSNVTLSQETSPGAADGGIMVFAKKLDIGTGAGCGFTFVMETGSNIDETGTGSDRLLICGQTIIGPNAGALIDWPSGGGGYTGPFTIDELGGSLPVELVYFDSKSSSATIELSWATSSEENFDYFEIERSSDAIDFIIIGKVFSKGGFEIITEYTFVDESPLENINYYRLKSFDYDGSFEYHNIISEDFKGLFVRSLLIYPNPVWNQEFTIRPNFQFNEARVVVKDLNGKYILSEEQRFPSKTFEVPHLNSGIYIVEFITEHGIQLEKIFIE